VARPEILLLDEPSLGLAPAIADELFGQFRALREEGTTLLIVDQMADYVLGLADRAYVLGGGRVVAQGKTEDMRGKMLDETYLGACPGAVS
jgi:ABC-type branched-subunit amino acid transport system ATPase component